MSILASLRQLRFPRAIRIAPPIWPEESWDAIEKLAAALKAPATESPKDIVTVALAQPAVLAQLATGLWRLRQKMVEPGTDRPQEEMRKAFRHFQSIWDLLTESGVQIQDHTNTPFDAGLSLKVLTYQPTPGLTRERVIETVKPSVYHDGRAIQMGEVIVGTPEKPRTQGNTQGGPQ